MTKSSPSHHSATTETTFRFSCKLGAMQVLQAAWPEVRSRELSPKSHPRPCIVCGHVCAAPASVPTPHTGRAACIMKSFRSMQHIRQPGCARLGGQETQRA